MSRKAIAIYSIGYSKMEIKDLVCKANTITKIIVVLSIVNSDTGSMTYKKALTKDELNGIREDLGEGNHKNELLKNQTCVINWRCGNNP